MTAPICPYCSQPAALITGAELYPHRRDLAEIHFWRCAPCDAHCGCHRAGCWAWINGKQLLSDGTLPLGTLANAELRLARHQAHSALDPIWQDKDMSRRAAYQWLSGRLGIRMSECHIAMFDLNQCRAVVRAVLERERTLRTKNANRTNYTSPGLAHRPAR